MAEPLRLEDNPWGATSIADEDGEGALGLLRVLAPKLAELLGRGAITPETLALTKAR